MKLTDTKAYEDLVKLKQALKNRISIENIEARVRDFEIDLGAIKYNYGFSGVDTEVVEGLLKLAVEQGVEEQRDRMFKGAVINETEGRSVLHWAARAENIEDAKISKQLQQDKKLMEEFAEGVREGKIKGVTGKRIRYAVNIGVGGSDLGVRLGVTALEAQSEKVIETLFLAGIDNREIDDIFDKIQIEETLFVIVSKTFTTQETLMNARAVKARILEKLGNKYTAQQIMETHFAAVTTSEEQALEFGIDEKRIFHIGDFIGGRFSVWSGVGLCLALSIGAKRFREFLHGAAFIDKHFKEARLEKNMPIMLGLVSVWHRNFEGYSVKAIAPYSYELRLLPKYLQQLEMESNGKSITRNGELVDYETAPVIFGDIGTFAQHSFFQLLHQGTDIIPVDFIAVSSENKILIENMAAQVVALAFGSKELKCKGGKPSNIITLAKMDAYHLGGLLALYEHSVFVQGILWDINSFDQPGVELGKKLAKSVSGAYEKGMTDSAIKDSETAAAFLFKKIYKSS